MIDGGRQTARGEPVAGAIGDRSLQRAWVEHRRWVAAILLAYKPKWADLEDLLQEVAVSLVRKGGEIRDPNALKPWLRTVAINAAHAAGRSGLARGKNLRLAGLGDATQHMPAQDRDPAGREADMSEGRRLMELAAELPEGYREPLLLKAVQGLSYRQIGEILGLPETTIETRIARGRKQLREMAAERLGMRD